MSLQTVYDVSSSIIGKTLQQHPFVLWRTSTTERPVLLQTQSTRHDSNRDGGNSMSTDTPKNNNNNMEEFQSPSSSSKEVNWAAVLAELALTIGMAVISSMLLSLLTRRLLKGFLPDAGSPDTDSTSGGETQIVRRLRRILLKRGIATVPALTGRELQMADEILDPDDLDDACTFADIGGLDAMKQELYELAIVPLVQPELFRHSKLIQPPKGVLLYGKPGTGKTMLAKALAKEAQAVFLPLQLSKILNKYWGESNKLIAATFSLANKLQPAIIFIDELDTFLKNSSGGDGNNGGAYMDSIKAEFLTLWDGVATQSAARVLVLGATNQPHLIDAAILRRMPRAFEVPLPDLAGRLAILQLLLLRNEHVDASVISALPELAELTVGYSGSDLKELCKAAAMVAVQEHTAEFARRRVMGERVEDDDRSSRPALRPMSRDDLLVGWQKVRRTGEAAQQYGRRQQQQQSPAAGMDRQSWHNLATLLRSLSQLSTEQPSDDMPNL